MMTTYTRRGPGQSYLKSVLAERINSLIEHKDLNLEINPLKVKFLRCFRNLLMADVSHLLPRSTSRWSIKLKKKTGHYLKIFLVVSLLRWLPLILMCKL